MKLEKMTSPLPAATRNRRPLLGPRGLLPHFSIRVASLLGG